jgi:hypothetical protein
LKSGLFVLIAVQARCLVKAKDEKISRKSSSPTYSSQKLEFEPSEGITPMIAVAIFCSFVITYLDKVDNYK